MRKCVNEFIRQLEYTISFRIYAFFLKYSRLRTPDSRLNQFPFPSIPVGLKINKMYKRINVIATEIPAFRYVTVRA